MLSTSFLLALVASFAFKPAKKAPVEAYWIFTQPGISQCMTDMSEYTDQSNCSPNYTGPVCTVTPGALSTRTAYFPFNLSCTVPWRQP